MRHICENFEPLVAESGVPPSVSERVKADWKSQCKKWINASAVGIEEKILDEHGEVKKLRLAIICQTGANMIRYRDEAKIYDEVLLYLFELMDMYELRITGSIEMG